MSEINSPRNVVNEGEEIVTNIFSTDTKGHYFEQGNKYYYGIKKVLRIYTKDIYPLLNSDITSNSTVNGKNIKSVTFEYEVKSSDNDVTFENIGVLTNGAKSSVSTDTRNYYNLGYIYITGYKLDAKIINIDMPYTYTMKFGEDVDPIVIKGIVYDTIDIGKDGVCDAIDCQLYYRPFYYNALLLLTPTGFTKNSEYTMDIPTGIQNTKVDDPIIVNNAVITKDHLYNMATSDYTSTDQTVCYGRLFYSIANGLSIKENITNEHNTILNTIYTLDNVTLQTIVGNETNVMKLKKPFRNYSEMSHSTSGETFAEDITGSTKTTKMMMYGITEPFTKKNGKYERGVPIVKTIDSIDIEQKIYDNKISNANTINDDFNVPIGDIVFNNLTSNTNIEHITIQTLNVSGMTGVTFDTSQPMSVAFSVTEGHLMGEEGETIASYYNGIKFYENIYVDKIIKDKLTSGTTFYVDGYSSRNIRYFAIQINDGDYSSIKLGNELANLLRGIYYMGPIKNDKETYVQYDGLNCNEYLKSTICDTTVVYRSGWRDIHTALKLNGDEHEKVLELSDNEPCGLSDDDAPIDITSILKKSQIDGSYTSTESEYSNGNRTHIVGVYSEYTRLTEDEYEEEKTNMFSVIKKHVPKFSVVKLYELQERNANSN